MGKQLIIAEKPKLAGSIVKAIGQMAKEDGYYENESYIVTFVFGHLLELKSIDDYLNREKTPWNLEELPFFPEKFEYKIKDDSGVKKQYKIIENLFKRSDVSGVINAGDSDREGSVIVLNLMNQLEQDTGLKKPVLRIWIKATTPDAIGEALRDLHPEEYYGNLYEEGLTRTYVDWLYGINYSRFISCKAGTMFPVGRVLIAIIKFIYDRDKSIADFKKEKFFEIGATIHKNGEVIKSKIKGLKYKSDQISIAEEKLSNLGKNEPYVESVVSKEVKKSPQGLFSLDKLQNKMSSEEKMSMQETLDTVQSLYEDGYVTYPRTNSGYMNTAEKPLVESLINHYQSSELLMKMREDKKIFDDSKVEGHTALIITNKSPDMSRLSEQQKVVYNAIKNRFIANFLVEECIITENTVTIKVGEDEIVLNASSILQKGFLKVESSTNEKLLPAFEEKEKLKIEYELLEKETQPPKPISESDLNNFFLNPFKKSEISDSDDEDYKAIMSGCQIGTVATRASIVENALKYEYITKQKNALFIAKKGVQLLQCLVKLGVDLSKQQTVKLGMDLKSVFNKEKTLEEVVKSVEEEIIKICESTVEIEKYQSEGIATCPLCKKGQILAGAKNYYCTAYKDGCTFTIWKEIAGKKMTESQVLQLIQKGKTSKIKGFTAKSGKSFDASLILNKDGKVEIKFTNKK